MTDDSKLKVVACKDPMPPRTYSPGLIAYAATDLDAPPAYCARNYVRCRGERLSRIIWQGRQWAVTRYGIEARDGSYVIAKSRLWENEATFGWIEHMSEKDWTDLEDFAEALRLGRRFHAKRSPRASGRSRQATRARTP